MTPRSRHLLTKTLAGFAAAALLLGACGGTGTKEAAETTAAPKTTAAPETTAKAAPETTAAPASSAPTETTAAAAATDGATESVTVTDLAGREITIEVPIESAVIGWTGSGGPFMTMSALLGDEVADHIAGWDSGLIKNRNDMYEAYVKAVPGLADIPIIGSPNKDDFNFEKVVELQPEAVIFPLGLQEATDGGVGPKLEAAGIPVIYMDYHAETVENHTKSTMLLGQLFGKTEQAEKMVERYTTVLKDVQDRVAQAQADGKTAPRAYLEVGYKGPNERGNTYASGFMWGALMDYAGGDNITKDAVAKAEPIAPEFVLDANPEVIVLTGSYWPKQADALLMGFTASSDVVQGHLTAFSKRPGWENLDAIKNKRLHSMHHGMGRELYDYVSVMALAKAFYPEALADLDPSAELKAYYDDFLPYDLDGVWFEQWK